MTDTFDFTAAEAAPPDDPGLDEQDAEASPVADAEPGTITDTEITQED